MSLLGAGAVAILPELCDWKTKLMNVNNRTHARVYLLRYAKLICELRQPTCVDLYMRVRRKHDILLMSWEKSN